MSPSGWENLMSRVIERATRLEDRRLEGLKHASSTGSSESFLRRLGIICEADLDREMPLP